MLFLDIKKPFERFFVKLEESVGEKDEIWTLSMNTDSKKVPIVMVHGFGAGIGFWVMNFDKISEDRPLYAIDLLGFGRSSRPDFSSDPLIVEQQFVDSIENWRKKMDIPKMILLGHSFGGFLATSYSLKHPDKIEHVILADPWGFAEAPTNLTFWKRTLAKAIKPLKPLWILRASGPFGQWIIQKGRKDILKKYDSVIEDNSVIAQYIHQCNCRYPSGEAGFHKLLKIVGWAKFPIGQRTLQIQQDIPITFLYGAKSWMNNCYGPIIKESRPNSYTHIENILHAGHHVYSDNPIDFNQFVFDACQVLKSDVKEQSNN